MAFEVLLASLGPMVKSSRSPVPRRPALSRVLPKHLLVVLSDTGRGPDLAAVMKALPRGSLFILRDYERADRAAWVRSLVCLGKRHGHFVLVSGDVRLAQRSGADGVHLRAHDPKPRLRTKCIVTAAVHTVRERAAAQRKGATMILVSPVFPTRSHTGIPTLGIHKMSRLIAGAQQPVIALGGLSAQTAKHIRGIPGIIGIAAIDGWTSNPVT